VGPSMLLRARGLDCRFPGSFHGRPVAVGDRVEEVAGMDVEQDEQEIIERVAALDIGKAELVRIAGVR